MMICANCGEELVLISSERPDGSKEGVARYVHEQLGVTRCDVIPCTPSTRFLHREGTYPTAPSRRSRRNLPGLDELERRTFAPWRGSPGPQVGAR